MRTSLSYVLITPARNEVELIERTIKSVLDQTVKPLKWIIVSDGSTDGTDEIVSKYAAACTWIELLRMPERQQRHFAGKVLAFNAARAKLHGMDYDAIGSLDADISFPPEYFSFLLQKLSEDRSLGLIGTPFQETSGEGYDYRFVSIEHVSGACQFFRRECFEAIGGYTPVEGGGIDHIAVMSARMKGWKTRTFPDKFCIHHRSMGTAEHSVLKARFRNGIKDYRLGSHPVWQVFRMLYQMTKRPFVIGGIAGAAGYFWAMLTATRRAVQQDMADFRRDEEMKRLKHFLFGDKFSVKGANLPVSRAVPTDIVQGPS
jgi:biofilm PGA synthesis N-glycosyltransferase PgaC